MGFVCGFGEFLPSGATREALQGGGRVRSKGCSIIVDPVVDEDIKHVAV